MYKLIVKYDGFKIWNVEEWDSEVMVYWSMLGYDNYMMWGGVERKLSFFIEKEGVVEDLNFEMVFDILGKSKLVS